MRCRTRYFETKNNLCLKKEYSFLIRLVITLASSIILISPAKGIKINKELDFFRLDIGRYPNTYEGLSALYKKPKII